jgi:8-oxo-dGTP diphosphatase
MSAKPYRLVVKAVILDRLNRCLLIRRSARNRNFVGCWEWPGGKLDPGEDFATGLRREVLEEAGLEIELTALAGATQFEMPTANVILLCLEARPMTTSVRLSEEHDDFAWVPLDDLKGRPLASGVADFMLEYAERRGISPPR